MWTTEDHTVAAGHSVTPARWQVGLEELLGRVANGSAGWSPDGTPGRSCSGCWLTYPERTAGRSLSTPARLPPTACSTGWPGAVWDHDGVRDDVRDYLLEDLADPAAVLVVDETGDLKNGTHTRGVARQDTGTAGKVDNAQVAVYLTYATSAGMA
jgi:hypothetical protein